MAYLPLANILHYKCRSVLSALGISLGICMLITLGGLSRGSLHEIADRWEAVDAELIVFPRGWGNDAATRSGSGLGDGYADKIRRDFPKLVERVVPVFTWTMKLAGQDQMIVGVDPKYFKTLTGGRKLEKGGRLFDPDNKFADWIVQKLLAPAKGDKDDEIEISEAQLSDPAHNGLEIVIDTRLARAGDFRLGQVVAAANHRWKIVGIVEAGAMARVFMPRRTAQFLFGSGDIRKSTLMFVKLKSGVSPARAVEKISAKIRHDVVPLARYRGALVAKFNIMFVYVDIVNAVAMILAFLFIMVTLYTMVLQRTRDIAILISSGAGSGFIIRQVLGESLLLTGAGAAGGIALSFLAGWAIETIRPLLTVTITWEWIGVAMLAAAAGAVVSALYPAWQATRVDVARTLTLE